MRNKRGFTIVESLVAIFLATLLTIFIFGNFTNTKRGLYHSENAVNASIVGQSVLNDARRTGFDTVTNLTGTQTINGMENGRAAYQQYNYSLNVESVTPDKKMLWVTVTWSESGQTHKLVIETLMAKY